MRTSLGWGAVVVLACTGSASAMGPTASIGFNETLVQSASDANGNRVEFNNLVGPIARVGFEIGDRFNHELSFQFSQSSGTGSAGSFSTPVTISTYAGRYTFSVDFFTKRGLDALPGFTPTLGVGLAAGTAKLDVSDVTKWVPYLEFHAVVGARYTFESGLGLRLELVASTYGGFFGVQPSIGASYRF